MSKPYIVGITGGSASGKTLFLKKLLSAFSEKEITLISQDNYYKPRNLQPIDDKGIYNFDTPNSIDFEQYAQDITHLKEGKSVFRQEYTFNNPNKVPEMLEFKPAPIIVVEGIFVFYYPELEELLDLKVFIDAKDYIRLKRRIIRDNEERGYGLDDVLYRYENHVMPTYEKYIEPFKHYADIIVPNNTHFENALNMVTVFLKNKIKTHDQ
ncbi:uridine kinase [Penaeicola halotolerans]|uniref:uridine kinase n=1 Tax=Penaeicola halotolerans TaxID=2793196 RepID=UPI001CF909C6|nr:uridine kinase [Penaeicola halotolerans]